MWLFLAFLVVPLIEIALFIQVGGAIGLGWTLLIVVATAIAGTYLVRAQGIQVLGEVRGAFNNLQDPRAPLAHGAMILFSGALLLTPGFFTDAVGFALLIPSVRMRVYTFLRKRIKVQKFETNVHRSRPSPPNGTDPIDVEYRDVTDDDHPRAPSGWTKR